MCGWDGSEDERSFEEVWVAQTEALDTSSPRNVCDQSDSTLLIMHVCAVTHGIKHVSATRKCYLMRLGEYTGTLLQVYGAEASGPWKGEKTRDRFVRKHIKNTIPRN